MQRIVFVLSAVLAPILLATSVPASAQQDVAEFYRGKTVRIVVGTPAGSGYDINARVIARYLGNHIPGNPTVVVENQPGGSGLAMTNALFNDGPFDGTAIGASFNGTPTLPLLQPDGVRFDPVKLNWIGSSNRETQVTYLWHTSPIDTFADIRTKEVVVGAQEPGSTQYDYAMLVNRLFGFKFKVMTGYESTTSIHAAMEAGTLEGSAATNWTTLKTLNASWLEDRKIKVLAQWALRKHPDLTDVPMVLDLARNDADRQALLLALARLEFGRPFFLPPNVPAERVTALRRAFSDTMRDANFRAEAEQQKLDVDALTGAQVAALVEQVARTAPETTARVRAAMEAK